MKNYYEILEVSMNASNEVIEKAYKVLAKKNHPDLQEENKKENAEQKMKLINEAYEILSDSEKKKSYDIELQKELEKIKEIEYERKQQKELRNKQRDINRENNSYNNQPNIDNYEYIERQQLTKEQIKEQMKQEKRAKKEYQEEQDRIYRNYMRNLGYIVKERWSLKRIIKLLKIISIFIIVIIIIWFLPPTHKLIIETYEQNELIKITVDIIIKVIKGIVEGFNNFLKI